MTQRATPTFAGTQEAFFQKAKRVELDIISTSLHTVILEYFNIKFY